MKKILLSIFVVSLVAFFAGCLGGSSRVASLTFTGNDGNIAAQMEILPNYKERTLNVRYTNATGSVGGEYFDRFEEVVKFVKEYEVVEGGEKEMPDGLVVFSIKMEDLKANVKEVSAYSEVATSLYLDLAKVLTEEEQV